MTRIERDMERLNYRRLARKLEEVANTALPMSRRKRAARLSSALAEKIGILVRPPRCERCGRHRRLERHHERHDFPLDVRYLCAPCHRVMDGMVPRAASVGA